MLSVPPTPKRCCQGRTSGKGKLTIDTSPVITMSYFVFTVPRQPLDSVRILQGPWSPFTITVPCLVSATLLGLPAVIAVLRAGSALVGPMSLGGSAPAVQQATTDSHTASVSDTVRLLRPSLVPRGWCSCIAGLLRYYCGLW